MNNMSTVQEFIVKSGFRRVGNHDVLAGTGIRPHQQVFQLTQKLLKAGQICGQKVGNEWEFWSDGGKSSNKNPLPKRSIEPVTPDTKAAKPTKKIDLDFANSLVLVSCVKSKLSHAAPASELYNSALFRGMKDLAEASGAPWFILSAKHGLVDPHTKLAPYELTLKSMSIAKRRAWAQNVLEKLVPLTKNHRRIVIFAGASYREFLLDQLKQEGLEIVIPMEGLSFGKQLSWLTERT
jgi:hypothetical protein